uniref:Uncharacterized protein n=1 Tax=Prevotella sp. GTC17254 TaxID=3236794 RepID=A0AB33J9C1_9BACT
MENSPKAPAVLIKLRLSVFMIIIVDADVAKIQKKSEYPLFIIIIFIYTPKNVDNE